MTWDNKNTIGNLQIDNDHKKIMDIITELENQIETGFKQPALTDTLVKLSVYCHRHFRAEELAMEKDGFPGLENHKLRHNELIKKVGLHFAQIMRGNQDAGFELLIFLYDWWNRHIVENDMEYARFTENQAA